MSELKKENSEMELSEATKRNMEISKSLIHCPEHAKMIESEKGNTGYCNSFEWEIGGNSISVNQEYWIKINYCPFCGKKILKEEIE